MLLEFVESVGQGGTGFARAGGGCGRQMTLGCLVFLAEIHGLNIILGGCEILFGIRF